MNVSVIVPAHNAAETLGQTLDSLVAQSWPDWEAIVVDDGSTDTTAALAGRHADRDPRFRAVSQRRGGEAAARNAGLARARSEWLLFLDADDWLAPMALERLTAVLAADPSLDGVYAGWARVVESGDLLPETYWPDPDRLFPALSGFNALAVHSCLVRSTLVHEVGGFDTSLGTCADWDLWQRIARAGARFGEVRDVLAFYRTRRGSSSSDAHRLFQDGLRLIARGHSPDPRVPRPQPDWADGMPRAQLASARLRFACWPAGLLLGQGKDARPLLRPIAGDRDPDLGPEEVAGTIFKAVLVSASRAPKAWIELWPGLEGRLGKFLQALEEQAMAAGLARRSLTFLERWTWEHVRERTRLTVGRTHAIRVEVTRAIPALRLPRRVERLHCAIDLEGQCLGTMEMPVCDGRVPASVLADAIASDFAWAILGRFFERTIYSDLELRAEAERTTVWRGAVRIASDEAIGETVTRDGLHDRVGWTVFLQELWGRADWPLERFYGEAGYDDDRLTTGEERAESRLMADDGWRVVEASEPLTDIETARAAVAVELSVAGTSLGVLSVPTEAGRATAQRLLTALTGAMGFELCRAAVREGILGGPLDGPATLRERLALRAAAARHRRHPAARLPPGVTFSPTWRDAVARAVAPNGRGVTVLARRATGAVGTSASRRASLPVAARPELLAAAAAAGEHAILVPRPLCWGGQRIAYAPDLLERTDRTPENGNRERIGSRSHGCRRLPILLYHRIAETGVEATARYRVAPTAFERQVRHLSEAGYRSVRLEDWRLAREWRQPLDEKAIVFTFDDGYRDFLTHAWPILRRYGFSAMVFLVTDLIGATNTWDAMRGEQLPLLGWEEISSLQREGVEFGSHSATHRRLTGLSPADVVREAARSRAALTSRLGCLASSLAYPHGAEDSIVHHLVGASGYSFGLSCRPGSNGYDEPLLALSRIEVTGSDDLQSLVAKLGG